MLRRTLWLLIGLAHLPALIGSLQALAGSGSLAEHLPGIIGLTLSILFFALKVRDVAFLRFHTDRRSCVALFAVVALLHVDVLRSADSSSMVPETAALVATTWLLGANAGIRRPLNECWTRVTRSFGTTRTPGTLVGRVWLVMLRPHPCAFRLELAAPRGPPL